MRYDTLPHCTIPYHEHDHDHSQVHKYWHGVTTVRYLSLIDTLIKHLVLNPVTLHIGRKAGDNWVNSSAVLGSRYGFPNPITSQATHRYPPKRNVLIKDDDHRRYHIALLLLNTYDNMMRHTCAHPLNSICIIEVEAIQLWAANGRGL